MKYITFYAEFNELSWNKITHRIRNLKIQNINSIWIQLYYLRFHGVMVLVSTWGSNLAGSWFDFFSILKDLGFYDWFHFNKLFSDCFWILHISCFIIFSNQNFFLKWFCRGPWRGYWIEKQKLGTVEENEGIFWCGTLLGLDHSISGSSQAFHINTK